MMWWPFGNKKSNDNRTRFEIARDEVEAYIARRGLPKSALPGRKRKKNFPRSAAQLIVEADPDPLKRWSLCMAKWMRRGDCLEPAEHMDDIEEFMLLRRIAKKVPKGSAAWRQVRPIVNRQPGTFRRPSALQSFLVKHALSAPSKRGKTKCKLPVYSKIGPYTMHVLSEERQLEDEMVKQARWCVVGSYFGNYGGPPYYPISRGSSWVGIVVPGCFPHNIGEGLRNGGNNSIMDVEIVRLFAKDIIKVVGEDVIAEAIYGCAPSSFKNRMPGFRDKAMPVLDVLANYTKASDIQRITMQAHRTGKLPNITIEQARKLACVSLPSAVAKSLMEMLGYAEVSAMYERAKPHGPFIENIKYCLDSKNKGLATIAVVAVMTSGADMQMEDAPIAEEHRWMFFCCARFPYRLLAQRYGESFWHGWLALDLGLTPRELATGRLCYGERHGDEIALHFHDGRAIKWDSFAGGPGPITFVAKMDAVLAEHINNGNVKPRTAICEVGPPCDSSDITAWAGKYNTERSRI